MTQKQAAGDGTGSLEKALDVLDVVGTAPEGMSQSEVAQRLALPRTTVYRLLATLVARGLLRRDPVRKVYGLGLRCFEMARQAYAMPDVVAAAAGELRNLRDLTGETTYLATLEGAEVLSLERYDGAHSQRSAAALGQRKPVHCTSQGKAILAAMGAPARDALVRELALKPLTPHTITDRRKLQAELKVIAARGWSMDDEEIVQGVRCVGAPVVDAQGNVRGAISVAGPAWRVTRERAELLGPEVAEAARRIGSQLRGAETASPDSAVRPIAARWAFHGAFPRWDPATQRLFWTDALAPSLRVCTDDTDQELAVLDQPVTGLVLRGDELLLAHEKGAVRATKEGQTAPLTAWPHARLQALCNGDDQVLWAAFEAGAGSAIGQVQPGGHFKTCWTLDEPAQALCWNAAERQLVAAAPASGSLLLLREGSPTPRRLATIPKGSGRISGLAVDAAGGVWTALQDGWGVMRISLEGEVDRLIALPIPCPTDVAVGGADGKSLYITTARQSVPLDVLVKAPLSGSLFVTDL
jgi:IclR family transcriptional regulator, acetate operon repressor